MTARPTPLRIALASLCLAAASLPGCIEEDRLSAAIEEVSMKLESLGAPGTAIPGAQLRNDTYSGAISTLKPLVAEGTPEQKAAAWLLIARSEFGLAGDPTAEAADARREAAEAVKGIRAELVAYREAAALAAATRSFNPDDEIAELQAKISERAEAAQGVQAQMGEVLDQIAGFEALASEARAASNEHRATEADLRAQALSLSAQDALPIVRQAAEQRSRADDLAAEADRRDAEADVLRPQVTALEGEIDRLTQQQRLFEESIESLNTQRETAAAEADEYQARADEIAQRAVKAITDADAYLAGPFSDAHDAAFTALETAAESAAKASASRTTSKLLEAEISHTLGGTAQAQTDSLHALAAIAGQASDAGISDASLRTIADANRTKAADAEARAIEALTVARDAFESAGVRGENEERIDRIVGSINTILGEPTEPEPAPEPESDEPVDAEPADADPVDDEPVDADAEADGDA